MSAYREPKREHPERMCYRCADYFDGHLDWGECRWMAETVPGDEYRSVYAYGACAFGPSIWRERE